jgi:peptide/nickel transport system substrate-binding protein
MTEEKRNMRTIRQALVAAAAAIALTMPAAAQELRIGLSAEPSSADPHFHNLAPNSQLRSHIFEALMDQDKDQQPIPKLAESVRAVDELTWELKLRRGVKFTDGTEFTARDVIFSYCRVPKVENSPSSFVVNMRAIATMEAVDSHTLKITTATPHPLLRNELSNIGIISARAAGAPENLTFNRAGCTGVEAWPKTEDFNNLKLAVGTGPYRYATFTRGDRIVLERNEGYWGEKPHWQRITLRPITQAAARVAALLAGDVDFIENPPIQDLPRIKQNPQFSTSEALSSRIIYLHFNYLTDGPPPGVTDTGGKNPFRDRRVREAISLALDRNAIVQRIMGGVAVPAAELLPNPLPGTNAGIQPARPDVERAKRLLAEAGFPNGFALTLATPNDRYINDGQISQAVAQMLTRIGIRTQVEAMTASTFFARRNRSEFGFWLAGWGADTGEMSNPLRALAATPNRNRGMGTTNPGGYSNPDMDTKLFAALETVDDAKRNALLAEASKMVMADFGLIPLHYEVSVWAFKRGLTYVPQMNQYTRGDLVSPAPAQR